MYLALLALFSIALCTASATPFSLRQQMLFVVQARKQYYSRYRGEGPQYEAWQSKELMDEDAQYEHSLVESIGGSEDALLGALSNEDGAPGLEDDGTKNVQPAGVAVKQMHMPRPEAPKTIIRTRTRYNSVKSFRDIGTCDALSKALEDVGFLSPSPIQTAAFSVVDSGDDVVIAAETGAGKTLAYLVPILHRMLLAVEAGAKFPVRALIIQPNRDLCVQVISPACPRQGHFFVFVLHAAYLGVVLLAAGGRHLLCCLKSQPCLA